MFWGLIMEPNKRYTQVVEKPFHISQAAMDISTGDIDPCQVMVVVDGKNFLICTLQKNKNIQVPLDLYFKSGDAISFLTNGKCNVHLTGYLDPEFEEEEESDVEEEDEDEAPTLVSAAKRKLENSNEKKAKKQKKDKKVAQNDSSDSDEDGEDQLQKILDGEDLDTDDNDESFKLNTTAEDSDSDEEESDDEEEAEDEEGEEEEDGSSEEAETSLDTSKEEAKIDTSKEEAKIDTSKLSKSQRRRLKKKLQKEGKEAQVNGVDKPKKDVKPEQQQKEKKKPEKKEAQQNGVVEKKEKKTISGGVAIEDLKVGNGPIAKPGKNVMVYYEGRLKSNNKMFDNCLKGPGFKFRLGAKEVISGWDVGVSGMKVGGKRRIICPPNMAYGAKGSPPVIPPNSTLVFEVELKNVK